MNENDALLERLSSLDPALTDEFDEERVRARVMLRGEAELGTRTIPRWRAMPRLVAIGAGGVAVAAALALAVTLVGPSGTDKLNVVAEARAALPDQGELVHLETVQTSSLIGADDAAQQRFEEFARRHWDEYAPQRFEQWATDDRWRVAEDEGKFFPKMFAGEPYSPGFYIPDEDLERLGLAEEVVGPTQEAFADGIDSFYVEEAGVLIRSDLRAAGWETDIGSFPGGIYTGAPTLLGPDPVEGLRKALEGGHVEEAGTAEVNGREVRLLVQRERQSDAFSDQGQGDVVLEYAVDAETFEPVRVRMFGGWQGEVNSPHPVERMAEDVNFVQYEVLPLDVETEALLEIDTPPGTTEIEALGPDDQPPRPKR